jgi:hypothetical protein
MSTTRPTEAQYQLANAIRQSSTQERAAQLIADSESLAVERALTAEREKVRVLREALDNLLDEQNGAPLSTREEQWKQAMDGAEAALAATEAKP